MMDEFGFAFPADPYSYAETFRRPVVRRSPRRIDACRSASTGTLPMAPQSVNPRRASRIPVSRTTESPAVGNVMASRTMTSSRSYP